jgi:hypothetical protein
VKEKSLRSIATMSKSCTGFRSGPRPYARRLVGILKPWASTIWSIYCAPPGIVAFASALTYRRRGSRTTREYQSPRAAETIVGTLKGDHVGALAAVEALAAQAARIACRKPGQVVERNAAPIRRRKPAR